MNLMVICNNKQQPVLDGVNAKIITEKYGLNELCISGSTADLYKGNCDSLRRLTIDAGSHNLLVSGSETNYNFPNVIRDYGIVGISDDEPEDRYWLLDVERCYYFSEDFDKYIPLISALSEINEILQDNDPADCNFARKCISKYRAIFEKYSLLSTINYIVEFADMYQLNLDFSPSNFMLSEDKDVVATDPVYGPDPEVFE